MRRNLVYLRHESRSGETLGALRPSKTGQAEFLLSTQPSTKAYILDRDSGMGKISQLRPLLCCRLVFAGSSREARHGSATNPECGIEGSHT